MKGPMEVFLTDEQKAVTLVKDHEYIFVQAFAGTGKTTTLLEFVKMNKAKKILYLTFNNSLVNADNIQTETGKSFDSYTIHGLAFKALNMEPDKIGRLSIKYLKKIYDISSLYANLILRSFEYFLSSTSLKPKLKHVYNTDTDGVKDHREIVAYMRDLWEGMDNGRYNVVHDFYLKKYMTLRPELDYDIILIDECQDITPCFMKILYRQKGVKLFVGDIYQQIYSFRNVLNPFKLCLENRTNLNLSRTFRFGDDVCTLTNDFLNTFRNQKIENGLKTEAQSLNTTVYYKVKLPEEYTYIARTNKELLMYAYQLSKQRKHFEFVGKGYKFAKEINIFDNLKGKTEDGIDILTAKFGMTNLKDAKSASRDLHKYNWVYRLEMVEKHDDNPWRSIEKFELKGANIKLTSAHQSKGLEFDNVVLANDFKKLVHPKMRNFNDYYHDDDYNILYVAMTRPKKKLYLNDILAEFLKVKYDFDISLKKVDVSRSEACHACGSLTNGVVEHSMHNLPEYVKPNHKMKVAYCSDCVNLYLDGIRVIDSYTHRK